MNQRDPLLNGIAGASGFLQTMMLAARERMRNAVGAGQIEAITINPNGENHPDALKARPVEIMEIDDKLMGRKRGKQVKSRVKRERVEAEADSPQRRNHHVLLKTL